VLDLKDNLRPDFNTRAQVICTFVIYKYENRGQNFEPLL
jgi:hypothetical protein